MLPELPCTCAVAGEQLSNQVRWGLKIIDDGAAFAFVAAKAASVWQTPSALILMRP